MSIHERDILFYAGGAALERYGTACKRTARIGRRGEDVVETFTRAGAIGSWVDRSGVIHRAAANIPRINHWNVYSGAASDPPLWLLEGARTNLCTDSEDFSAAAWTNTRSSDSTNVDTAPDGLVTADRLIEDATASDTHYISDSIATTASAKVALSVFVKAGTRTWICIEGCNGPNDYVREWFNLSTGAVGTYASASGENMAYVRSYVESYGSDWYRCILVITNGDSAPYAVDEFRVYLATGDGTISYSGDGSSYVSLWGAQPEDSAAFASSYIPTSGGTATRGAETCSFPFPYAPEALTSYARFVEHGVIHTALYDRVFSISDSGAADASCGLLKDPATDRYYMAHDPGTGQTSITTATSSIGDVVELVGRLFGDGSVQITQSLNAGTATSGTRSSASSLATAWSDTVLWFGNLNGNACLFNPIEAIIICRGSHILADFRALLP